ncbi:MAG TPA: hypothetical protein PLV41_07250, partial [Miltoncostaeales bacterium]|nr:hypothetical protein [Miltoncostaeales bacterium]
FPSTSTTAPSAAATTNTTSTTAVDQTARLAAIQQSAEQLRSVSLGHPVAVERIDRQQATSLIRRLIAAEAHARRTAATDDALHLLGALGADEHLQTLQTDGLAAQVAGLYDPATKKLYVVDGTAAQATDSTLLHEIVHALQDARYDLQREVLAPRPFDADGESAAQAVAEGDATEVQTRYLQSQGVAGAIGELGGALNQLSEVPADQRRLPPFLQRSLEFPYIRGAAFVTTLRARGGEAAVDRAFRDPPKSTLQVLIPERYLAGNRPPVAVTLPKPDARAQRVLSTTFGAADLLALGIDETVVRTWRGGKIALDRVGRRRILSMVVSTIRPADLARALRRTLPRQAQVRVGRAAVSVRIVG